MHLNQIFTPIDRADGLLADQLHRRVGIVIRGKWPLFGREYNRSFSYKAFIVHSMLKLNWIIIAHHEKHSHCAASLCHEHESSWFHYTWCRHTPPFSYLSLKTNWFLNSKLAYQLTIVRKFSIVVNCHKNSWDLQIIWTQDIP
jgi:hypothetical protein